MAIPTMTRKTKMMMCHMMKLRKLTELVSGRDWTASRRSAQ